eukprot:s5470_g5.t1
MPSPAPATWPPLPPPTTTWGSTGPNATTSATPNPARVPLPKSFKEDEEHYDSNLVFKATVKKNVEPTAWSRATGIAGMDIRDVTIAHLSRRGLDEFGFRGLLRGRFTGLILTHNVAETVLLSQLQKKLREDNIDVDAAIDALYKSKSMKPPDKLKEAATYVAPLVDDQDPPQKRRRLQRADAKKSYQQMLEEPFNVIKISGQDPPTSMSPPKTWTTNIKKNLPADKQTATDNHTQQVQNILEEGKFTKAQLQEMATRWGLPISLITSTAATPKTLQQLVSAVTLLAV